MNIDGMRTAGRRPPCRIPFLRSSGWLSWMISRRPPSVWRTRRGLSSLVMESPLVSRSLRRIGFARPTAAQLQSPEFAVRVRHRTLNGDKGPSTRPWPCGFWRSRSSNLLPGRPKRLRVFCFFLSPVRRSSRGSRYNKQQRLPQGILGTSNIPRNT